MTDDQRRALDAALYRLGATGQYPHGKTRPTDEGELKAALTVEQGRVVLNFGKRVDWLSMTPGEALTLARLLVTKSAEAEGEAL